jgi:hypothetical protein
MERELFPEVKGFLISRTKPDRFVVKKNYKRIFQKLTKKINQRQPA